ncbi:hypothetical protein [Tateyamaria pelophila]|uniref:hypothetical protein n=1 Tax=Tateyamaria pelophila TaxID=328415 RepID=UPI001CBC5E2D|nr:hypothetical protein [Tateyamaria pelophila]
MPSIVDTPVGTLELYEGVPTGVTVQDNLDRMRGMVVFLDNFGAVPMYDLRKWLADAGAERGT